MVEPVWTECIESLRARASVPAAQATAALLARAEAGWAGRVVPRTSMHDLLFTLPAAKYPFDESVRVS